MTMYYTVALIIAYNNPNDLQNCLEGLRLQSCKVSRIIIIDNSSETYIPQNKKVIGYYHDLGLDIYYERTDRNRGSAGGYAKGMQIVQEKKIDFLWLNDQDGMPESTCLEKLLESFQNNGKQGGIYAPKIIDIQDSYELKSFRQITNRFKNAYEFNSNGLEIEEIDMAGTTGILIHKDVLENVGIYNDEIFFVGNEDFEYSLRTRQQGYPIYYVQHAIYRHPDLIKKYNEKRRWITRLPIPFALRPLNLGIVSIDSYRLQRSCLGASYINEKYVDVPYKWINYIYSCIRTIIIGCTHRGISIKQTFESYQKGKMLGKRDRINGRKKKYFK